MGGSKISPAPIIVEHLATLTDGHDRLSKRDYCEQFGVPLAAGALTVLLDGRMAAATSLGILTLTSIFGAFMFSASLLLLDRAGSWADTHPPTNRATSTYATLLEELAANSAFAAMVAAAAAVSSLLASIFESGWQQRAANGVAVGLLTLMCVTLLLILRRIFLLTRSRLNAARTGTTIEP